MTISLFDFLIKITGDSTALEDAVERSEGAVDRMASGMNQKLSVAQKAFGSLSSAADKFTKHLFSMRGALSAVLGTGGLAAFVKSSLSLVDNIAKTADRVGLSVEAIQEYSYAAKLSGIETEEFESALIRLNAVLSEGGSVYSTTEEALVDIAERTKNAADATERAAIVNEYFGNRFGAKLIPLFKDGAAGLDELRRAAQDAGAVFSEDFVRQTEAFNDELDTMMLVLRKGIAEGLLEGFVGTSKDIKEIYTDPAFIQGIKDFGTALSDALTFIVENAETILRVFAAIGGAKVGAVAGGMFGPAGAGLGAIVGGTAGAFSPELYDLLKDDKPERATSANVSKPVRGRKTSASLPPVNYNERVTRKEFEITDEEFAEMAAQIRIEGEKAQKRAQEDLLKAQEDATKQLGELELTVLKSTGHIREAIEKEAEAAIAVWEERAKKGIITEQELARARILILTNAATDMEKALESASGTADTSGIAFESWARNFTDDLAGAITKMKDLDDVLKNFLLRLLQAELSNSLFNLFGLGKGGGGGGGFGGIVVPALSSIFGFANGGRPRANRVSLVGEHEPEFFIPDTAGEIYPLSKLGKEGTQVVLNINAPGADAGVVERVRLLAQTEIIPQAVQASLYAYRSTMRPSH
jgi:hypothetical protein